MMNKLKHIKTFESFDLVENDEINEAFEFRKARKEFKKNNKEKLEKMNKAYKSNSESYIELSKELKDIAEKSVKDLANKFGIKGYNDIKALSKDLIHIAEPVDIKTFKRQSSFSDIDDIFLSW